jgi:hypothetical protein
MTQAPRASRVRRFRASIRLQRRLGRRAVDNLRPLQVPGDGRGATTATPYHTLVLLTTATNTQLDRRETLVLARFNSTQESVDAQNQATGGGVKRADFEWEVGEKGGELSILVAIEAEDGLALHVAARGPAQIDQRVKTDPNPSSFRFIDAGLALGSFRLASIFDQRGVPSDPTNVGVSAKNGRLELPGDASVSLLGVGPRSSSRRARRSGSPSDDGGPAGGRVTSHDREI